MRIIFFFAGCIQNMLAGIKLLPLSYNGTWVNVYVWIIFLIIVFLGGVGALVVREEYIDWQKRKHDRMGKSISSW